VLEWAPDEGGSDLDGLVPTPAARVIAGCMLVCDWTLAFAAFAFSPAFGAY
jgi:hypothetical protein